MKPEENWKLDRVRWNNFLQDYVEAICGLGKRIDSLTKRMNSFECELSKVKEVSDAKVTERDRELLDYLRTHTEYKGFAKSKGVSPTAIFNRLRKLEKYGLVIHLKRSKWAVRVDAK